MFGLTQLGVFHTAVSLIALGAAAVGLLKYKNLLPNSQAGKVYLVATLISALTGFGIFAHGGFGKPHVLGVLTLLVLALAAISSRTKLFGRAARYIETVSYSLTLVFHLIPAITETTTRLPLGAPLFQSPEAPAIKAAAGVVVILFLLGAAWQVRRLRAEQPTLQP